MLRPYLTAAPYLGCPRLLRVSFRDHGERLACSRHLEFVIVLVGRHDGDCVTRLVRLATHLPFPFPGPRVASHCPIRRLRRHAGIVDPVVRVFLPVWTVSQDTKPYSGTHRRAAGGLAHEIEPA